MRDTDEKLLDFSVEFVSILLIPAHRYKSDQRYHTSSEFYMSSEEVSTEDSVDSLSEVSSLDDDFSRMHFESASSDGEVTENEVNSSVRSEIESESDDECLHDHGIV